MNFLEWCTAHKVVLIVAAVIIAVLLFIICIAVGIHKRKKRSYEPHFRKFHDKMTQGHPQYIFDEEGNKYKIIGVTHAPKTGRVANIRLKVNPEPGNNSPAYIRPTPNEIDKKTRSKKLNGWKIHRVDKKKIKKVIRKSKKTKK